MAALRSLSFCLLAVGLLLPAASTGQMITAEAGQDSVTLPCRAEKDKEITDVWWIRPGLDPDVVFLFTHGRFHPDRQHPSFRNRVDLQDRQMKDGDASLILKEVTINDTGTYLCTVTQGGGGQERNTFKTSIHLQVSPPPGQRIRAEAGQDVTLPCGAGKGAEVLYVWWIRPDLNPEVVVLFRGVHFEAFQQNPSFRSRVDLQDRRMRGGDASLVLKDVTIKDTGTYECKVIKEEGGLELMSSIHLEVSSPPELRISAEAGQDVSLPCETGTETKILLVEWIRPDLRPDVVLYYRDDHLFQNLQHASFRNRVDLQDEERRDGNASLVLRDVKMNDTGTYQCRLIQGAGAQDLMLISTVHLEVSPPPGARDAQLELTVAVCVLCLLVVVVLLVLFHQKKTCWLKWFPCRPPEEPELDLKSLLSKYPPEQRNQMLKSLLSVYPPAELKKLLETEDTSSL
ncbi:butyrophilin-like protein 2 isoform 2-T2 [Menidia menidia]